MIGPPQVVVDRLRVTDTLIAVDSPSLTIASGYIPGQMLLTTPESATIEVIITGGRESPKSKLRKGNRKNIRSTSVENSGAISFASMVYGK